MPKNTSSSAFDGSAARNLSPASSSWRESPPASTPPRKSLRGPEPSGSSDLPGELSRLRSERDAQEEVSKIRRRIGEKIPTPGASAVLAIEHAKSLFSSKNVSPQEMERTRSELLTAKQMTETAVLKARTNGNEEAAGEYFSQIQEIEGLLEMAEHHTPEELEETMTASMMKENKGRNAMKLAEYAQEKRNAVQGKIQPVQKELREAKAMLEKTLLDNDIMEDEANRMKETIKKGGWEAIKLQIGDGLRRLKGMPSILDLQKKVEDLELKKELLRGEMAEFAEMGRATPEQKSGYQEQSSLRRPKTPKVELRREAEQREARLQAEGKTVNDLEKDILGDTADYFQEIDLSELKEEEPINLVRIKKAAPKPIELSKETRDLAERAAKKIQGKSKPVELDFEELEQAIEKQKKEPVKRRVPPPPASLQLEAREAERRVEMNVDKANTLVPNAEALWYKANEYATPKTAELINALEFGEDAQQTKLVFLVARYRDAKNSRAGAMELKKFRTTAERAAAILKINRDPEFLKSHG